MTVARSVARAVASPVARAVGGGIGGGGIDEDAAAYFTAVEGAGGSFDLSGINAAYTETYVKSAHSALFSSLKSNGVWDKLLELYLFCGKTFEGVTVKAKGTGSLTNNGFLSGDYTAAGSGAGLVGDASSKYINTGFNPSTSTMTTTSASNGFYHTAASSLACSEGAATGAYTNFVGINHAVGETWSNLFNFTTGRLKYLSAQITGLGVCSRTASNSHKTYANGISVASNETTGGSLPNANYFLFAVSNAGTPAGYGDIRKSLHFLGTGLNDADNTALNIAIVAFMTKIGANV